MTSSLRLQLLTCLMVYASSVHGIMVKFGTNGGPIVPPTPEPVVPPSLPYRAPAPVWETRAQDAQDTPDPNAQWRPQLFKPQPLYTQIYYTAPQQQNSAQKFVNAYIPQPQAVQAQPITAYFTPAQVLSSQALPGVGLRYFVPTYVNNAQERKYVQEDARHNQIETNDVASPKADASEYQWQYEKDAARRDTRTTSEGTAIPYQYQWPAYVPRYQ